MILNLMKNFIAGANNQYPKIITANDFYIGENDLEVNFIMMTNDLFFHFLYKEKSQLNIKISCHY